MFASNFDIVSMVSIVSIFENGSANVDAKCEWTLLPPSNEAWGKIIFLHLSVILFTGGSTWAGTPWQVHCLGRYTPQQVPPRQVHPPGRYNPAQQVQPPQAGTLPWQVPPWAGTPPDRYPPRQVQPPQKCMLGYGQQAGGTHPTGMHSCLRHRMALVSSHP